MCLQSTLAAARADNFYYPKDWDPSKVRLKRFKYQQGNLTDFYKTKKNGGQPPAFSGIKNPNKIRFEMMFNVRCLQCKNSIGKGVRFNAHKKCVDQYLSTKIYEFTMNCHLCENKFVIRTDPKNCDYVIVSGLDKRPETLLDDQQQDQNPTENPSQQVSSQHELNAHRKKLESNAFYKLEAISSDKLKASMDVPRLEKLIELKEQDKDFFQWNQLMRKRNREKKNEDLKQEEEAKKPVNFCLKMVEDLNDEDRDKIRKIREQQCRMEQARNKGNARDQIRQQSIFGQAIKGPQKSEIMEIKKRIEKMQRKEIELQKDQQRSDRSKILKHMIRTNNC